jgi:hypothetical protein
MNFDYKSGISNQNIKVKKINIYPLGSDFKAKFDENSITFNSLDLIKIKPFTLINFQKENPRFDHYLSHEFGHALDSANAINHYELETVGEPLKPGQYGPPAPEPRPITNWDNLHFAVIKNQACQYGGDFY